MRIVNKQRPQTVDFRTLSAGQPFYYPEEEWYGIKLNTETDAGENAVDIETGELAGLGELSQVVEIRGQFEILG